MVVLDRIIKHVHYTLNHMLLVLLLLGMVINNRLTKVKDLPESINQAKTKDLFLHLNSPNYLKQRILKEDQLFNPIPLRLEEDEDNNSIPLLQQLQCLGQMQLVILQTIRINQLSIHPILVNNHSNQ